MQIPLPYLNVGSTGTLNRKLTLAVDVAPVANWHACLPEGHCCHMSYGNCVTLRSQLTAYPKNRSLMRHDASLITRPWARLSGAASRATPLVLVFHLRYRNSGASTSSSSSSPSSSSPSSAIRSCHRCCV